MFLFSTHVYINHVPKEIAIENAKADVLIANLLQYDNETFAILHQITSNTPTVPQEIIINSDFENSTKIYKDISDNFVAIENFYITRPLNVLVHPDSVFYEKLDKHILECLQHGLLNTKPNEPAEKSSNEPQVLTLQLLEAGFFIWLCSILLACVAFICEHIVRYN